MAISSLFNNAHSGGGLAQVVHTPGVGLGNIHRCFPIWDLLYTTGTFPYLGVRLK